jgi:hypothetical protein
VSVDPCIKWSYNTVGLCDDLVKVASPRRLASGEPKVSPSLEGVLERDVNPPGLGAFARGWARARRDRVPCVD